MKQKTIKLNKIA